MEAIPPDKHCVSAEEVATLWRSENTVVNQKSSYFLAANAFLVAGLGFALQGERLNVAAAFFVASCGVFLSLLTLSSIGRTCAYRDHLIRILKQRSNDYAKVLTPESFPWYAQVNSSVVLQALPVLTLLAWLCILFYISPRPGVS